jgi:hypothetical protein
LSFSVEISGGTKRIDKWSEGGSNWFATHLRFCRDLAGPLFPVGSRHRCRRSVKCVGRVLVGVVWLYRTVLRCVGFWLGHRVGLCWVVLGFVADGREGSAVYAGFSVLATL